MLEEVLVSHEPDNQEIWELTLLDGTLKGSEPQLDHICTLAEWNAELMGRQQKHDPLLLLLKKFFTGDWRKKIGDKDESTELLNGMSSTLEKVPLQRVLRIIQELNQENSNLAEKIARLKEEIEKLSTEHLPQENEDKMSSVNQLLGELQASTEKMKLSAKGVELSEEDKAEVAEELADFIYMLAKLKNAKQDKFPHNDQLGELLEACGGFSFADAVRFCYYKYGSRIARERVEASKGKNKKREKIVTVEIIKRIEQKDKKFDLSKIDIGLVKRKMREILFQIIGAPERMVVTCDLTIHGKYNGKDVRLLIPRKQNFIFNDPITGDEAIAYSNFMTTGAVGNHQSLQQLLEQLPTGTIDDSEKQTTNGYKIEKQGKVVRIQGIPTADQKTAISALTTLEIGIEEMGIINFNTDIVREAFIGLSEDEAETKKTVEQLTINHTWNGYAEIVRRLIIDEDSPRLVQTVPSINNFKSGRTGINTHALLFRGELRVREETIKALIEAGSAQYMDSETTSVTAPILVINADRKNSLLAELSTKIDNSDRVTLNHSVIVDNTTFGEGGPKIAISTNSLL